MTRDIQAENDLARLRARHAAWSRRQFGADHRVGPVGPARHLAEEALEVASAPTDVTEYADCQMLLWDMQRRAGISDAEMAQAIDAKLAVNQARTWPAPEDGAPRWHLTAFEPSEVKRSVCDIDGPEPPQPPRWSWVETLFLAVLVLAMGVAIYFDMVPLG